MARHIDVYLHAGHEVFARLPDTPAGLAEARRLLGVSRLSWLAAADDDGLVAVAVCPGDDPADARPMACLVEQCARDRQAEEG